MRLAIFGSTGPTGRELVQQALAAGHYVTAYARTPTLLDVHHERLSVMQGDVLDPARVAEAVVGQDAVLSALGVKPWNVGCTLSEGTRHIVAAMRRHGVRRLIVLSSYGVSESWNSATLPHRLAMWLVLRGIYRDKARQDGILRASDRDWVLVRPSRFTKGPRTGDYRVASELRLGLRAEISRADVADFMLRQLTDGTWLRQAVVISY
jgi:putative NADH-flavin reductase